MKYLINRALLVVLFSGLLLSAPVKAHAQDVSVSLQLFYDELSPYGQWADDPEFGYVWIPSVNSNFSPYSSDGHWVFTQDGWTWVSDYSWGWAPFHYGRWDHRANYGWIWIPDTQWGPAWVSWRRSPGYYGWAPLGPGISISFSFDGGYNIPSDRWVFVRENNITRSDVRRYYVPRNQNVTIIRNTTIIKNTYVDKSRNVTYVSGPDRMDVQKHTGRTINPVVIQESNKPGQNVTKEKLVIYRPQVVKIENNGNKPKPVKVEPIKDIKPKPQQNKKPPADKKPKEKTVPPPNN